MLIPNRTYFEQEIHVIWVRVRSTLTKYIGNKAQFAANFFPLYDDVFFR